MALCPERAVVMVTHDVNTLIALADRVIMLDHDARGIIADFKFPVNRIRRPRLIPAHAG